VVKTRSANTEFKQNHFMQNVDAGDPSQAPEWLRACRIVEHLA